jgi:aspartyl-tRNA(Asn)/glutamyl-tRNA(Gln) amidotransferase subunit A
VFAVHKERLEKYPEKWDKEVRERILNSCSTQAYEYVEAQQFKQFAIKEFEQLFNEIEILITPTVPILPTDIDQRYVELSGEKEHVFSVLNRLAGPKNLLGFPSLSIPAGLSNRGLPIGLQLIGKPFDEANIYRFAQAFELARPFPLIT